MNKKQKILPGIFIMIIVFVGWIIKPAHSENHRWYSGDYAQVVSICESDDILRTIAELYMTKDPVDNKQAEELWFYAVASGECVQDPGYNLTVKLWEKLETYKDVYGKGASAELWSATVLLPTMETLTVFVGILGKKGNKLTMPNDLPSISL